MRILLIDPFHGAAGDMIVGSLLHLGADRGAVIRAMRSIVGEPEIREVSRRGIRAIQVDTRAGTGERRLEEILDRLVSADAPDKTKEMAERVFRRLHAAEEHVHGVQPHFHDVGADDAIAEVLGACVALDTLPIDGIQILPVAVGRGTVRTAHGILPVPVPAVAEILKDSILEISSGDGTGELCTPTGAAILAEFGTRTIKGRSHGRVRAVGYGAGSRDDPDSPNVLRTMICETEEESPHDIVDILETNVDDITGEVLSYTIELLMNSGARDASASPLVMKKGRPGFLIRVICDPPRSPDLAALMARELGTLGVRRIPSVHRCVASRTVVAVVVEIGGEWREIEVKCSWQDEILISLKPEYEQCRTWAREAKLPLRDVLRMVESAAWAQVPWRKK
ncbi:MAG: nickel pincer cofactor biosynthesis protein LarC [Methanomicrobiales archaeon]|nr:nickel pincer cofactor biosynthesis protein LarC [Methanomicrobiales archaeon]